VKARNGGRDMAVELLAIGGLGRGGKEKEEGGRGKQPE